MGINMRVNAISFTGKQERIQRQQALDDKRDQMLDMALLQMLPQFANGEADILFINTIADENDDLNMAVKVMKEEEPKSEEMEGFAEVEVVQPKKTLLQRLKDVFKK